MHKLDQIELQLDQSQLPYSEYLGSIPQEIVQPDSIKKGSLQRFYPINRLAHRKSHALFCMVTMDVTPL